MFSYADDIRGCVYITHSYYIYTCMLAYARPCVFNTVHDMHMCVFGFVRRCVLCIGLLCYTCVNTCLCSHITNVLHYSQRVYNAGPIIRCRRTCSSKNNIN